MTNFNNTLAAVNKLAGKEPDTSSPNYQLLETLYNVPWSSKLLYAGTEKEAERLGVPKLREQIALDPRLVMLDRWLGIPLIAKNPLDHPDSEIMTLRPLLAEILNSPELPEVYKLAKALAAYLDTTYV